MQHVQELTPAQAETLRGSGRVQRIMEAGAPSGRAQLLAESRRHHCRLVLTGAARHVDAMRDAVAHILGEGVAGTPVVIHAHDVDRLRKPTRGVIADVEEYTGCRVQVQDRRETDRKSSVGTPKAHKLHLFGQPGEQKRALQLIASRCDHLEYLGEPSDSPPFLTFNSRWIKGSQIEIVEAGSVVRCHAWQSPRGCVVASDSHLIPYALGSFVALGIRKVDAGRVLKYGGCGLRVGVAEPPLSACPDTLLTKPGRSWVLGRGFVRGTTGSPMSKLDAAQLDAQFAPGDEMGVLATRDAGSLAVFRRPNRYAEWKCLVHWHARIPAPMSCVLLLELTSPICEVEILPRQPPLQVGRPYDETERPPPLWDPLKHPPAKPP